MGSPMMMGILGGYGRAQHQDNLIKMQQEYGRRQMLAEHYLKEADNPRYLPEAQQMFHQAGVGVMQSDTSKALPKEYEADKVLNSAFKVHVQPGSPGWLGGQTQQNVEAQNQPISTQLEDRAPAPSPPPQVGMGLSSPSPNLGPPPAPPPGMTGAAPPTGPGTTTPPPSTFTAPMPAPPPDYTRSGMYSPEEMAQMQAHAAGLHAGAVAQAEMPAKLAEAHARYEAEFQMKMNQLISSLNQHNFNASIDPISGRLTATPMSREQLPLNVAANIGKTEAQTQAAQATAAYKSRMLPYQQRAIESLIKYRGALTDQQGPIMQMRRTKLELAQQEVQDRLTLNSPEAMDQLAEIVHDAPEVYKKFTGKAAERIALAMAKKGYGVPGSISQQLENQESSAHLALAAAREIRDITEQFPNAFGPIMGRIGLTEQEWGSPIYPKDSAEGQAEQRGRTAMTYLLGHEGKALFGGRAPQQFLNEMRTTSPNPTQAKIFLDGALQGVENNANNVVVEADRKRYGTQQRTAAPNAPPGAPVTVQLANGRKGQIDPAQVDKFLRENLGSKVVR